jgi:hypothetical protein
MLKTLLLMAAVLGCLLWATGCGNGQDRPAAEADVAADQTPPAHQAQPGMPHGSQQDAGAAMSMPGGHPPATPGAEIDLKDIAPAEGGKTVAQIHTERQSLTGSEVAVRGRVVKFLPSIMGKNWLHLRDGTGTAGTNDLTVTTQATVKVGDLVTVTGEIQVDRDFGAGYRYNVIMEDATVVLDPIQ